MRQEGGNGTGDERTQDGQAGLEIGENATVRSQKLFQLAAVFGLLQDDRWTRTFPLRVLAGAMVQAAAARRVP